MSFGIQPISSIFVQGALHVKGKSALPPKATHPFSASASPGPRPHGQRVILWTARRARATGHRGVAALVCLVCSVCSVRLVCRKCSRGGGFSPRFESSALDFPKDLASEGCLAPSLGRPQLGFGREGFPQVQILEDRSASAKPLRETPPPCDHLRARGKRPRGPDGRCDSVAFRPRDEHVAAPARKSLHEEPKMEYEGCLSGPSPDKGSTEVQGGPFEEVNFVSGRASLSPGDHGSGLDLGVRRSRLPGKDARGDWAHPERPLRERMRRRSMNSSMEGKGLRHWFRTLSNKRGVLTGALLSAITGIWLCSSGCAATTGAAGAALGYGLTGNARGAALGAGAGILAGSMFDAGIVQPYYYYPGPYYGPRYYAPYPPGRWVHVPGHWDYFGRWIPPHTKWVPY